MKSSSIRDILVTNVYQLASELNISAQKADILKKRTAEKCISSVKLVASTIIPPIKTLPLDSGLLDECLSGGVAFGAVTEFTGEAGSGKTQALLMLLANALAREEPADFVSAVAITTEEQFLVDRFSALFQERFGRAPQLERLQTIHAHDADALVVALKKTRELLATWRVSAAPLIVIDSIAAPVRAAFESTIERAALIRRVEKHIRRLTRGGCAVVTSNQVSAFIRGGDTVEPRIVELSRLPVERGLDVPVLSREAAFLGPLKDARPLIPSAGAGLDQAVSAALLPVGETGDIVTPSLGLVWATCVDTRVALRRIGGPDSRSPARELIVLTTHHGPSGWPRRVRYEITARGLVAHDAAP